MNTFSKVLSMFLVVVMCFGLFATSAFAESFNFDNGNTGSIAAAGDGFNFQGDSTFAGAAQPESAPAAGLHDTPVIFGALGSKPLRAVRLQLVG